MPFSPWLRFVGAAVAEVAITIGAQAAEDPLEVEQYVAIVLRSHPGSAQAAGLRASADAERKAARLLPDPTFEYSRDRARSADAHDTTQGESSYAVSQAIPWPGTFGAGIRAADRAADVLRADADIVRWELQVRARSTFARLVASRAQLEVALAGEADARSLRDLITRRADLGESREADRIKGTVEWLRQQRSLAAAAREARAAETTARMLAVEPLPEPLAIRVTAKPIPLLLDDQALVARLLDTNPRARAARAEAERQTAVLSVARRGRLPDLGLRVFRNKEVDKQATGVSIGIKLPLWNANRGEIARAEAAVQTSGAEAERVRLDLRTELEARLKDLEIAAAQAALLDRELLPAADQSMKLARFSFEEGETSLLDLLDAQRTYRDAQREATEAHLAFSLAVGDLQSLMGPEFDPWR